MLLNCFKITFQQFVHRVQSSERGRDGRGSENLNLKLSAEQILHSNLKQRKWSIGHVAIRKFHAWLTQSSCLRYPDWTLLCLIEHCPVLKIPIFFIYIYMQWVHYIFFIFSAFKCRKNPMFNVWSQQTRMLRTSPSCAHKPKLSSGHKLRGYFV